MFITHSTSSLLLHFTVVVLLLVAEFIMKFNHRHHSLIVPRGDENGKEAQRERILQDPGERIISTRKLVRRPEKGVELSVLGVGRRELQWYKRNKSVKGETKDIQRTNSRIFDNTTTTTSSSSSSSFNHRNI